MEKVVALRRKLYPADKSPDGHPDLADSLSALGALWERGATTTRRSRSTATR